MPFGFLNKNLQELFQRDEASYSAARRLVQQHGPDEALKISWNMVETEKGDAVTKWIKIARAIEDINRPEMLYHA